MMHIQKGEIIETKTEIGEVKNTSVVEGGMMVSNFSKDKGEAHLLVFPWMSSLVMTTLWF